MSDKASITPAKSLWKNRNFLLLWSGQFVSWVGTEISGIALPLLVLALTGSPAQAGFIAGIRGVVYVVWAIPAGALIDRWDRRTVMVIANLGSGLAMGSIFLALLYNHLTILQLYAACAIEGSFFVFANLSRFAAFPRVVSEDQISAAIARTSIVDYIAVLLGPALGGIVYQTIGAMSSFLLDAISYLINSISIFFINVPLQIERMKTSTSLKEEIREGMVWLWHEKTVRFLNILTAGGTIVSAGLYLLIIIIAKQHQASSGVIGIILAVGGAGGIAGSLCANKIYERFRFHHILIATTTLSFLIFTLYFFAYNIILLAAITVALNVVTPVYEVTSFTYSVSVIPDRIRGRVTSVTRLVVLGCYSLGFFIMGTLLQWIGTTWSILVFSCLLLVLALMTVFNVSLRQIER
ncbi:MAG TPA: MFS transporter [Ktedonobacteraceae bacterium]|nr:MFS transporter [Ktedonobacteraceae bacterium]